MLATDPGSKAVRKCVPVDYCMFPPPSLNAMLGLITPVVEKKTRIGSILRSYLLTMHCFYCHVDYFWYSVEPLQARAAHQAYIYIYSAHTFTLANIHQPHFQDTD